MSELSKWTIDINALGAEIKKILTEKKAMWSIIWLYKTDKSNLSHYIWKLTDRNLDSSTATGEVFQQRLLHYLQSCNAENTHHKKKTILSSVWDQAENHSNLQSNQHLNLNACRFTSWILSIGSAHICLLYHKIFWEKNCSFLFSILNKKLLRNI